MLKIIIIILFVWMAIIDVCIICSQSNVKIIYQKENDNTEFNKVIKEIK